ncbi:MAG: hypothetical protein D6719_06765 [Candidatus Dadabacteria bacterium]|nr:MAG: hypothetical protein D6719_06765 [Candidatus Dadabacteria bacterium]
MLIFAATVLMSLVTAYLLLRPLLAEVPESRFGNTNSALGDLHAKKERLIQVLKDLELDYNTDKLEEQDYIQTKRAISVELAKVLTRLENLDN